MFRSTLKSKLPITHKSAKIIRVCSLSLLCWGSLFNPAFASLENTLDTLPQDPTVLSSMDISPEKWGYFLTRKPFSESLNSPEVQEQIKEFQQRTGIDFVKELLPVLGTHISMGYYVPNHKIDLPGSGAQSRAKQSSVKANMHTLQTIVETYGVDWGGLYPKDLAILEKEAKKSGYEYWKDLTNPYTGKKGSAHTLVDIKNVKPDSKLAGQVIYVPLTNKSNEITDYFILGFDGQGNLIQDGNSKKVFNLTNGYSDWDTPSNELAKQVTELKKRLPKMGPKEALPKRVDSWIVSLDLRSGEQTQALLQKWIETVNKKNESQFKSSEYRGLNFYHLSGNEKDIESVLSEPDSSSNPQEEQTLSLGIVGERLLITLAGDTQVWKKAVDVSLDHKGGLLQEEAMTAAVQAFKSNALWAYANHAVFEQLSKDLSGSSEATEKSIFHGSGLGIDLDNKGLYLSNFNTYLPNASAEQKQIASQTQTVGENLFKLVKAAPAEPLFFLGITQLQQILQGSNPLDFSKILFENLLPTDAQKFKQEFSAWTQLDFEKDFWQELDHQAGIMSTAFDANPAKKWPQSIIAIGAKNPQQLAQKWMQKFAISQDKLIEAGWLRTADQDLADNLKQMHTALESFSEQSSLRGENAYLYPANVSALAKAANSEDPDFSYMGQYSLELTNPISKEQGIGKAFADYQSFKNSKDRTAFKGMILYEPVGKPVYSKESKQNLVTSYKLFAYTEDGYILERKSDGTITKPKRLSDRPWRWNPQPVESYQGSAIYGLQSNPQLVKLAQESDIQPSMSYFKDYLLLGANPAAIKQTIDHLQQSKTTLDKDPRFQAAYQRLSQDTSTGLFYFDLQSWIKKLHSESIELAQDEQEAIKEWGSYLQPLQHFSGNSSYNANGQGFKFQLGIDMDQVNFEKLAEAFGAVASETESSRDRARVSSVKANMHTLQTIAETYAVDWGGTYPNTIEQMHEEASKATSYSPYWKDFKNPFTAQAGVGVRGAVMNYSEYTPSPDFAGMVLYSPITSTEYKIYGCDENGELIKYKEQVFYLTNS